MANNTVSSGGSAITDHEIITEVPLKDLKSIFDSLQVNTVGRKILDYYVDNSIPLTKFDCESFISYITKIDSNGSKAKYTNYVTQQIMAGYANGSLTDNDMHLLIMSYSQEILSIRNEFMPFLLNNYLHVNHNPILYRNGIYKNLRSKQHLMWRKFIVENNLDVDKYIRNFNSRSRRRVKYTRDDFYASMPQDYQIGIIL